MNIYPQDLGQAWRGALIAHRGARMAGGGGAGTPPRLGPLGRTWTADLGLAPEEAADVATRTSGLTSPFVGMGALLGGMSLVLGGGVGVMAARPDIVLGSATAAAGLAGTFLALVPRALLRSCCVGADTVGEIDALRSQPGTQDPASQAFLALVRDIAAGLEVPEGAQQEVRQALRDLGDCLADLPPLPPPAVGDGDPGDLLADAAALRARARAEADPVVAGSLERRAEATEQIAQAAQGSRHLLRRARALREELATQVEAVRAGLLSYDRRHSVAPAAGFSGLVSLAQSVREVTAEAAAEAAARRELDAPAPSAAAHEAEQKEPSAVVLRTGAPPPGQ